MNIAFSALVIFFLLFPGIIFRIAYLDGPYSRRTVQSSFVDELILSLIPACFIQFIGYLIVENLGVIPVEVDEKLIYQLITGQPAIDFSNIETGLKGFLEYHFLVYVVAFAAGKLIRRIVLDRKLDYKYHFLRIHNEWYYLLTGRFYISDLMSENAGTDVYADVLVETNEGSYLYSGLIKDFFLSKDNGLDRIYFEEIFRRKLEGDLADQSDPMMQNEKVEKWLDSRYYEMPGDIFVIPYSQIKNINVRYLYFKAVEVEIEAGGNSDTDKEIS
ncbi:hypothetical protein [Persicitalea sp.]|uniref:hypothetical protein n=1 Tax=Persicitalea sp. TaxID=3100273 RepID=UPI003594447E